MLSIFKKLTVIVLITLLSACGSYLRKNAQHSAESSTEQGATGLETERDFSQQIKPANTTSAAVLALIKKARVDTMAGNLDKAMLRLERAVRIEPANATIWHYMAKLYLRQKNYKQASGYAAKSSSLVSNRHTRDNKNLIIDNWRIIAHASYRQGNIKAVQKAQDKISKLQQ